MKVLNIVRNERMRMSKQRRGFLCAVFFLLLGVLLLVYKEQKSIEEYLAEHSIIEEISFVPQEDTARTVRLYKADEAESYQAFITANSDEEIKVYFSYCEKILLDGEIYLNGDVFPKLEEGVPYFVQAMNRQGDICAEGDITFYYPADVSTMYITTETGSMEKINEDRTNVESAYYAVYTQQGILDSIGDCTIRGRGNSTWAKSQKPYSIDFQEPAGVLGMSSTADWALLSNWGDDATQVRNKIMFDVAREMGVDYLSQCEFVNLYLNGQYNGLYLLTQRVSVADGENEFLLEFDERYEKEINYFLTEHQSVVIKEPKEISEAQHSYITKFIQDVETAIYDESGINSITDKSFTDYLDMDSWSKMYMLQNYFVQWDVEFASFYLYQLAENGVLYAGPTWDFDMSCGKMYYGNYPKLSSQVLWLQDTKGKWLRRLSQQEKFMEYAEREYLSNYSPAISNAIEGNYWKMMGQINSAVEMDAVRWDKNINFSKMADELYNWLLARQAFLDDYYENPEEYCAITFEFPWGTVPYYVHENTALGFLPCDEYGEYDKYTDRFGYDDIAGWQDAVGNEVYAEDVIKEDVTYYPIYK